MKCAVIACCAALLAALCLAQEKPATPQAKPQPEERKAQSPTPGSAAPAAHKPVSADEAKSPLEFTMKDIDGKEVPLSKYKGDVWLIVNVASKCGYTPQYAGLEKIHRQYKDRGFHIAAFPCNDFNGQEPGDEKQIREFCTSKFDVTFDLYAKIKVKGDDAAELYKFLTSENTNPGFSDEIPWNFTKFLVNRDGKVVARFGPKTKPEDESVTKAIEAALEAKSDKAATSNPPSTGAHAKGAEPRKKP